ncbi:hypothetical protein BpHYR1_014892 [Brachionus plicatilis]|uniref:Uncharacterized protein n=1 Tax=Brachionus plicatilis TaxID=10195 RepID=A0A3M7RA04_BRAPC|nr:hypothetical protein BpHYR1_014892 [Brachionus plicatilis]
MSEISSSPSGITRINVNQTQSMLKTPIEIFKSKINLRHERKSLSDVSVQVDERRERPTSLGQFRDDTILNSNLIEHLRLKIDKISEELDLARPRQKEPKKLKPLLEKSKLIVVNLTPKPETLSNLLQSNDLNLPKKSNMHQTQIQHETLTDNQKKGFLNSTEQNQFSANILAEKNSIDNFLSKKNTSRIEELKIDDNQTPISTSFKTKTINERNIDLINDLLAKNDQTQSKNILNITKIDEINKKPSNNRSKTNLNDIFKIKSLNYYDDIMSKHTDPMIETKQFTKLDDKQVQTSDLKIPTNNTETQTEELRPDYSPRDSVLDIDISEKKEPSPIDRDLFRLNRTNDDIVNKLEAHAKRLETFYNGRKSWTVVSEFNEEKEEVNVPDDHVNSSDKLILIEAENKEPRKKKNLSVKIKLPDDCDDSQTEKVAKKRGAQKCCHLFFLLTLFFVAIGILAYFIVWNFVSKNQL